MRHMTNMAVLFALAIAVNVQPASAHGHQMQCDYDSDYNVQVQPGGIVFTRNEGQAARVFMHDGKLRVDNRDVVVSVADAQHLREYEQQVRALVPVVAALARDGVDIGYAALTTVVATLSDNGDARTRMLQDLRHQHMQALQQIDVTLGDGWWKAGDEERLFGENMENTMTDLIGTMTGDVVKEALSGDPGKLAALQARANALDTTLDKAVDAPAEKLGRRADALCPQWAKLEQLQRQLQFRLPDGAPLELISSNMDRSNKASEYAQR